MEKSTVKKKKRKTKTFTKKPKELSIKQLSDVLAFPLKRKRPKTLTKRQILENIQPFYDTVGISRKEHAHKYYAEAYDVEVIDNKSLDDSLFFSKKKVLMIFSEIY